MSVGRRLGAVLRLSSGLLVILALAWIASAVATGPANRHLINARAAHTATAQVDGSLVIAGGTGNRGVLKSLEFFDPVSGKSTSGPRLIEARSGHSAIALTDGRVLLTGGRNGDNALLASSEIYDAAGASLNPGASMRHARANHTSTLLADGRVLIAGGDAEGMAEIYDPATDRFADAGRLAVARSGHSAVRLGDGRVLLIGGYDAAGATAEVFNPATNTFSAVRGGLKTARVQPTLKLISDGKVQVYGGDAEITMEVYNPAGYFSSRGHLLRDSSAFRSVMYSPGQAALIAIPSAKAKHYAEDALGPAAGEFERTGHTATEVAAHSTMVVVGGFGTTGAVLDTVTELGSCGATVTTDLTDYSPGQTVVMSGSGWTPGEQITLNLHRDTNDPPDTTLFATADENGDWINAEYVVQEFDLNVTFVLTATGGSGCVAQTTFTDSTSLQSVSVGAQAPNPVTGGSPATYIVTVGFNGNGNTGCSATLSAVTGAGQTGLPAGTGTNFTPNPVPGNSTSAPTSTLTITTNSVTTPPGTYTFTVSATAPNVNGGQGCNGGTFTAPATLVVASAITATTTTVASSVNPSTYGTNVTFTATVHAGAPLVTTGSVKFIEGGTCASPGTTLAGPFALNPSGQAAFSTPTLTVPSHAITACYGGTASFAASSGSVTQTVNKATSTTTVTCPAHVAYTGSALTPCTASYTTSDGLSGSLTVAYTNNTNVGTANASATYAGDSNYESSTDSKTFAIDIATSTTTVTCPANVPYSGAALTPCTASYTTLDGLTGSLTVSYTNNTNAGSATASASYAGDVNHASSSDTKQFTIDPASSTTTVTCPAHATYTGSALTPCTANVTGAGSLNQSLTVTYSNNTNVGSASASASFAGDANHAASNDTKSFLIDQASSTTTVTCPANVTYTGAALTPCSANVTGAGSLNQSLTVTYTNNTNAGTASASASFAGDANHSASNDAKSFMIDQASSTTAVACPAHVTYTGSAQTPCTATVTGAGSLNQSLSVAYTNNTNAGTASAGASFAGDTNHTASNDTKSFIIDQASSTTTVSCPAHVTYTGSAQTPCTATVTGAGTLNQSLSVAYTNNTNAGTASASASFAGDTNHTASNDAKTFIIDPATSTTTVTCPANVTYAGAALTPCTATYGTSDGLTGSLSVSYSNNVDAGTATASATYAGDLNHASSSDTKNFTIDPAPSFTTVTCPANVTYTGAALTPCTASVTGAGSLNQTLTVTYSNNVSAGTATASAAYTGDANHAASTDSTTFAIDPAPSVTTVTCPAHVAYTGAAQTPCSADVSGAGGLNLTLTVTYLNNINAGTAGASASFPGDANHAASSHGTTFVIDPAPSSTSVTCPASVTYTGAAQTPCSATVSGAGGLNQLLSVAYANNTNAGFASASASFAGDANHAASNDSKTFIIDPATSTATVTCPASVTYTGAAVTPCSAVANGVGGLNQSLPVSYSNNVGVGSAGASASFAGDANHTGSSGSTTFLIDPAPSFTTVTCPALVTYTGLAQMPCTATVSGAGGLNLALAVGYGNNINAGTATASASYVGDANHFGSSNSASFTIARANASISVNAYSVTYNGGSHAATGSAIGVQGELLAGLDLGGTAHTAAGSYTDSWTFTDVTGNYNDIGGTLNDVIGKADATIVVTPYDVPYDTLPHTATGTAKGVLKETLSGLDLSGTTHSNVGTYNDTWTFTDVTGNYKNASGQVTDVIEACTATTSISSNFNGTGIAAGRFVWFNSNLSVSGPRAAPVAISFTGQTITSGYFSTPVPDSVLILDPTATTATTTFANGMWTTRVPSSGLAGDTLLSGVPYLVPAGGLRGGINPVTWSGVVSTGTPGIKLNWKWGAAVYTSFDIDPSHLGVKPVDDNKASQYQNSDHVGTPESFKGFVTGGARGGGGSNFTGSWSGTGGVTPVCSH